MSTDTRGVPNLVARGRSTRRAVVQSTDVEPGAIRQIFNPLFSFADLGGRLFRPGAGTESIGPVNEARSFGGIKMTPELALTLSAVWGCVWRYANTVSTMPLQLMRGERGNSAKAHRKHRMHTILHDMPNTSMSAVSFWRAMLASMMTWGVCYAEKIFLGSAIVGLKPLRPEYMTAYATADGRMRYGYRPSGVFGKRDSRDYSAEELFVVMDRTLDGYTALSRLQYGANALGLAMAGDRAAGLSYKNGLRASGILTIATWLKKDQRAAYRQLLKEFTGTGSGTEEDKQFGVLVAENATKFEPVTLKPQDVELLSSRRFAIEDVCRFYDTPPVLIGHSADGQTMWGSGVEQLILGWLKLGLAPVLRTIEQEIWRQLLTPEERAAEVFAEYNLESLLRGDSAARAAFYSQMSQNAIYTRNEIRARENLPPKDGGDQLTLQSNMMPLDKLGTMPGNSVQVRDALRSWLGLDDDPRPTEEQR